LATFFNLRMTSLVFDQLSTSGCILNPGAREFVPKLEQPLNKDLLRSTDDTAWGDECGDMEWGDQTWNNDNQWELQVNRMSAKWRSKWKSPLQSQNNACEQGLKPNQLPSPQNRRFGWEDKANLMSSIWSHPHEFSEQDDDAAFLSHLDSLDEKFLQFQQISATPFTARLLAIVQDTTNLEIPYAIITDFLMGYLLIKPAIGIDFFEQSELKEVCLSFWGPIMAEHGCPIRIRYLFDRIREDVEWAEVCANFHSYVEVVSVRTVCRFVTTESLHISPAPGSRAKIPASFQTSVRDSRKTLDLSPISSLGYLENIVLHALPVVDISNLVGLRKLRELNLSKTLVEDFTPLSEIISLERLDVHGTTFSDLSFLPPTNLTTLRVNDTNVQDLSSLVFCQKLSLLELSGCLVQNIEPLAVLRSLKYLYLSKTAVFDIYPLSAIATLKFVDLSYTCVSDVHALGISLKRHKALEYVNLEGAAVTDFAPLRSICVIGKSVEDSTEEWGSIQ